MVATSIATKVKWCPINDSIMCPPHVSYDSYVIAPFMITTSKKGQKNLN